MIGSKEEGKRRSRHENPLSALLSSWETDDVPCQLAKFSRLGRKCNNSIFLPLHMKRTRDDACPIPFCQLAKKEAETVCHVVRVQSGFAMQGYSTKEATVPEIHPTIFPKFIPGPVALCAKSTTQDDMARIMCPFLLSFVRVIHLYICNMYQPKLGEERGWGCVWLTHTHIPRIGVVGRFSMSVM